MRVVLGGFKPFDVSQIETLKKMGFRTDNEPGQKAIMGETEDASIKEAKKKYLKLDFIKHVEPVILHHHC